MGGTIGVLLKWLFLKGLSTYFSARWSIKKRNIYIELSVSGQVRCSLKVSSGGLQFQKRISDSGCLTTNEIILFSRAGFCLEQQVKYTPQLAALFM